MRIGLGRDYGLRPTPYRYAAGMKTLGIDLAASEARTAACVIEWNEGRGVVTPPVVGLTDDGLLEAMAPADKVGIDSPFGWPDRFVEAVRS